MSNYEPIPLEDKTPAYDALVAFLRDRYDDDLRWVADFHTPSYTYDVRYIRDDLKTELSTRRLDIVIHRTMGLFDRAYVEEVYTHLGHARALILQHEKATAVHVYLTDTDGFVVKLRAGVPVTIPADVDEWMDVLFGGEL
jgi:hypothetical protein